jgi:short-subunit dehydrogenase
MSLPEPAPGTQVLVTGASSGIGAEIARLLAKRGHDVALVARRRDRLEALAGELRGAHGVEVEIHERDLGDGGEREALIGEVRSGQRVLVGACNCAGFGTSGRFLDLDVERELGQLEVNIAALVHLTHAFAEPMVDRGEGAILNIASAAAFQPIPRLATYSATKAFVQSFSEAFHEELRGTGVSCTVLCPGPVETEWSEIAGADAVMIDPAKVSPQEVARVAVEAMEEGKRSAIPGVLVQALTRVGRHAPRTILLPALDRFLGR